MEVRQPRSGSSAVGRCLRKLSAEAGADLRWIDEIPALESPRGCHGRLPHHRPELRRSAKAISEGPSHDECCAADKIGATVPSSRPMLSGLLQAGFSHQGFRPDFPISKSKAHTCARQKDTPLPGIKLDPADAGSVHGCALYKR